MRSLGVVWRRWAALWAFLGWICMLVNADGCALQIIRGSHIKSSLKAHVYNNVLNVPVAGSVCITYADVDAAIYAASTRINVVAPRNGEWTPEDVGPAGELLLEASRIIAKRYGLTAAEIAHNLPLLDTTKTGVAQVCPNFASPMTCTPGKYRRIDGLCNNLYNPTWGATRAVFQRFLPADYSDGISNPRLAVDGSTLPNARLVSSHIHRDDGYHDHAATLFIVSWGQLMDHDFTLTAMPLDRNNRNELEECCHVPPQLRNPYCFEIEIPPQDEFYNLFNFKCLDFTRAFPGVPQNCMLGARNQFNILTGVIDGNTVYGGNDEEARNLRTGHGGLLRHYIAFPNLPLKPLLPLKTDIPDEGCMREDPAQFCFLAGEIRVNEQLILTVMHTLLMREHNRIATTLANINPHWDDEKLYQESRRIVAAQIQHITFNEFLPQLLGRSVMDEFGLVLQKEGYWDGYDPKVDPGISSSFSAAAFRFGHSLLPSVVERRSSSHKFIASRRLHELIRQPYDLLRAGVFDEYVMGMSDQPCQAMDDGITQEVTNHLFRETDEKFGFDLVAFNLQRGREFGVPGYGAWRRFCGLPPILSFAELSHHMTNFTAATYAKLYKSVEDIDLWSAGVSERPLPGSMLGPTLSCIIATQMKRLRRGDRYWYELSNQPSSFTPQQLASIRQTRLARIVCDNTDNIQNIQLYPMVLHDPRVNPRVSCKSGVIPHIDLTAWAEIPTHELGPLPPHLPPPKGPLPPPLPFAKNLAAGPPRTVGSTHQSFFFSSYGHTHNHGH